jgi:alkylhydroperoxidase family enzyme
MSYNAAVIPSTEAHSLLDPRPPEAEGARVEAIIRPYAEMLGWIPAGLRLLGVSPPVLEHYVRGIDYFWTHPRLSPRLLTLIRYLVSARGHCEYCIDFNASLLLGEGLDQDAVHAARERPHEAPLADKDKALLLLVLKAVEHPHAVEEADLVQVRALGWSDRDIFEAVWHGAGNRAFGTVLSAFKVEHEGAFA